MTRKGAGAVISAVRSLRSAGGPAPRWFRRNSLATPTAGVVVPLIENFRKCFQPPEVQFAAMRWAATAGSVDAADRRRTERRPRRGDALFGDRFRPRGRR